MSILKVELLQSHDLLGQGQPQRSRCVTSIDHRAATWKKVYIKAKVSEVNPLTQTAARRHHGLTPGGVVVASKLGGVTSLPS